MNTALWLAGAAAVCTCELAGRTLKRGWPSAAGLCATARGTLFGRLALVIGWIWLGWHVFAR
jgi:hypothetical protein